MLAESPLGYQDGDGSAYGIQVQIGPLRLDGVQGYGAVRHAVMLFEADGGVYAYIRERRLARAMHALTRSSSQRRPSIRRLAFECGFENEQVFSRAFRRKYGLNPSEVDADRRPDVVTEHTSLLLSWMKDL